jgi:hypothetical protein
MSQDDPTTAPTPRPSAREARAAELRAELAETDARRPRRVAEAHDEARTPEQARKLTRRERRSASRREQASEAQRARERQEAARARAGTARGAGARRRPRPAGRDRRRAPDDARPEPAADARGLVGGRFAGAFLFARILKRLVD